MRHGIKAPVFSSPSGKTASEASEPVLHNFASLPKRPGPSRQPSTDSGNYAGPSGSASSENGAQGVATCELCPEKPVFLDGFPEFARHLRTHHCNKEGGSFVCRYGQNNVCQTLPVEGVSDEDYAKHLRKCHFESNPGEGKHETTSDTPDSDPLPGQMRPSASSLASRVPEPSKMEEILPDKFTVYSITE
uniref:C2H2-type domain-containing protein n=1 Tax=Panagrellus redivivus TaxID=6233 RepID=A0A7E4VVG9_PANRE